MCQQCWKFLKRFGQVSLHAQHRKTHTKGSHQQRRYACTTDAHHNACRALSLATTRLALLSVSQGNAATHGWPRPPHVERHAPVVSTESQCDNYYATVLASVFSASRLHGIVCRCVVGGTDTQRHTTTYWCSGAVMHHVARVQSLTIQTWMLCECGVLQWGGGWRECRNAHMDTMDIGKLWRHPLCPSVSIGTAHASS